MNIHYSCVIFDMDGVIFDSETVWLEAFREANARFGAAFTEAERQTWCGRDEASIRRELRRTHPELDTDAYRDFAVRRAESILAERGAPLKDGFFALHAWLRAAGAAIGLATSSRRERMRLQFEKAGLDPAALFDAVVCGDEVAVSKPDPTIFLLAAKELACPPSRCYVLEDSLNGIEAAHRGGFLPIFVKDLIEPDKRTKENSVHLTDSLRGVLSFLQQEGSF